MAKKRKRRAAASAAAPQPTKKAGGKSAWRLMDRGSAVVAGLLAQRVSAVAWRAATGRKPPTSGRHPEVGTREAVAWAVVGGAVIELVKVGVRRWTAVYWVRSTGKLPPGMKPLSGAVLADKAAETDPAAPKRRLSRRSRDR